MATHSPPLIPDDASYRKFVDETRVSVRAYQDTELEGVAQNRGVRTSWASGLEMHSIVTTGCQASWSQDV